MEARAASARVGVVDIGSSTATLALYEGGPAGFIDRVDQIGRNLRLMRALGDGRLSREAIGRTVDTMREFARTARDFGADDVDAYATSAVRDATNRGDLVDAVRQQTGIELTVISGEEEARFAVTSAVSTLPVADGVVVDLGGGSIQLARVRRRRAAEVVSLPLGSLRTSDAFLRTDPPTGPELVALRRHADALLRQVPWLPAAGGEVVGIGGTIRTLGKIERRLRGWPIVHGHGYRLGLSEVQDTIDVLSRLPQAARAGVPGLAEHRVDTIVAGAVVTAAVLRAARAEAMLVSTYGLREGCAVQRLHGEGVVRDPRQAGLRGRFPSPGGAAARAATRAGRLFDRRSGRPGLDPADRPALAAAAWIGTVGQPARLLTEPLQGHTQDEVITVARLLGLLSGEVSPTLRALLTEALTGE